MNGFDAFPVEALHTKYDETTFPYWEQRKMPFLFTVNDDSTISVERLPMEHYINEMNTVLNKIPDNIKREVIEKALPYLTFK